MSDGGTRIGFLGAGRMASALARAWLHAGLADPDRLLASDPVPAARDAFRSATGRPATADNIAIAQNSDLLVLAVKPQNMAALCAEVRGAVAARKPLVVSIAAGIPLARLSADLGESTRLVRVMPNTPCLVGASASGFSELFPTRLRSTGTSFCYNVGRFIAAAGPPMLSYLATVTFVGFKTEAQPELHFRYAGLAMCSVYAVGLIALLFLPETKGKPLPE